MFDETWYSYVTDHSKIEKTPSNSWKSSQKESLLNQSEVLQNSGPSETSRVISHVSKQLNSPSILSVVRRSSSNNDLSNATSTLLRATSPKITEISHFGSTICATDYLIKSHNECEYEILDQNLEEYKLYLDHLELSERHLDRILVDTTSALDLLATLSVSFKSVESETTACQVQCEDLLAEQKRLMNLTDEIGTTLQYYGFLEPLTKRLNAAGASRLVTSEDFIDMLLNLNCCIEFMDHHLAKFSKPNYRDSLIYKTKYMSLLHRSLNLVQTAFSSAFKEVTDEVVIELRAKEHNETSEYILLYGKYETVQEKLGSQFETLLKTEDFAFGKTGDQRNTSVYFQRYHELWHGILEVYTKNREAVTWIVTENLKKFAATGKPETDFQAMARHAVQYVIDICHNEQNLIMRNFQGGPLLADYGPSEGSKVNPNYAVRLEECVFSHLKTLHSFIYPYLDIDDLERICGLINWLETMCLMSTDDEYDPEISINDQAVIGRAYLSKYLWKSLDEIFIKAAKRIQLYKPSAEELGAYQVPLASNSNGVSKLSDKDEMRPNLESQGGPLISTAYPTVKKAVELMILYNDGFTDRPRNNDVSYEIVHQTTKSLQMAATIINRSSGMMNAQLFLIKNLMIIENLLMTNEIPDSVRQSAEFDFSPIWSNITELYAQRNLFNPLALITPLVRGKLLPRVVDRVLDARKDLERILVQQITAFTKTWQTKLSGEGDIGRKTLERELKILLSEVFEDEITRAALLKMILGHKDQ